MLSLLSGISLGLKLGLVSYQITGREQRTIFFMYHEGCFPAGDVEVRVCDARMNFVQLLPRSQPSRFGHREALHRRFEERLVYARRIDRLKLLAQILPEFGLGLFFADLPVQAPACRPSP